MTKFIQTLVDGFAVGSLYALISLGYTMVYGILQFINFAHGDVFVLGAWVSLSAALAAGWTLGGDTQPIATWLLVTAGVLTVAGGAALVYERFLAPRLRGGLWRQAPRSLAGGSLAVVAAGVWMSIALALLARVLKGGHEISYLSGGAILLCAMLACATVGFAIERIAYKPLRGAPRLNILITAIGVSLLLQNVGQLDWIFGTRPMRMPQLLPNTVLLDFADVSIRLVDVIAGSTAILLMLALEWLIHRTKVGRAMRAVSYNPSNAALMGVNVDAIISFTFVLGSALAAAAGFLYAMKYPGINQTAHTTWILLGLKAFVAAVIGGIGNVRGAMIGGFLIGLIEMFGAAYISAGLRDVYVFSLLILVLLFRPGGILGSAAVEKV